MSDTDDDFYDSLWTYGDTPSNYVPKQGDIEGPNQEEEDEKKKKEEEELAKVQERLQEERKKYDRMMYDRNLMKSVSKNPEPKLTEYEIMLIYPKEYQKYKNE